MTDGLQKKHSLPDLTDLFQQSSFHERRAGGRGSGSCKKLFCIHPPASSCRNNENGCGGYHNTLSPSLALSFSIFLGIIDLFGTIGGLVEFKASLLASHGFVALALAYFAYDDLPKVPTELELEYFFEACDWMLAHPDVMSYGLGVMGVSKGSELALILATHRKEVTAVVGISPAHALIAFPLKYKGEPLAFLKFEPDLVKLSENGAMIFKESYPPDATDGPRRAATIAVEKIQGDILLICGTDDQNWRAQEMARKIRSRLHKYGKGSRCTIHTYPGTGHLIEPPYIPTCHLSYHKSFGMCVEWGGEPRQQAFAQEDSWKHILNFFANNLSLKNKKSRL